MSEARSFLPRRKRLLSVDHEGHGVQKEVISEVRGEGVDDPLQQAHGRLPLHRLHPLARLESPRSVSLLPREGVQGEAVSTDLASVVAQDKIPRKLSDRAHRRMKMIFDRRVNTTSCDPDDWLQYARPRWHPHKHINRNLIRCGHFLDKSAGLRLTGF